MSITQRFAGTDEAAPVAGGSSHFHHALTILSRRSGRVQRVAQAAIVTAALVELAKKAHGRIRNATQYQVAVPGEDDIYDDVQRWLIDHMPSRRRRALTVRSSRARLMASAIAMDDPPEPVEPPPPLRHLYDGTQTQTVTLEGHRIRVAVEKESASQVTGRLTEEQMANYMWGRERILFYANGTEARDAVLRFLQSLADARCVVEAPRTRFYMATRWGEWRRRGDLPRRSLDTVVLKAGQREAIVADVQRFLDDEAAYARTGLPWHRGYVFHGPPGTGKTSLAKALAEHFKLDVYYVPLSDLEADSNLLGLFASVDSRSMLVLEDVDIVHAAKSRDDSEAQRAISLSGLLNALDGLATPHGLITVMTTNHLEVLDPALVRPGRADRTEELGYLDDDQLRRLVDLVTGGRLVGARGNETLIPEGRQITHAEVLEEAKPFLAEPAMARAAIRRVVERGGRVTV